MTRRDINTLVPVVIFICSLFGALFSYIIKGHSNRISDMTSDIRSHKQEAYSQFDRYEQYNKEMDELSNRVNQLDQRS